MKEKPSVGVKQRRLNKKSTCKEGHLGGGEGVPAAGHTAQDSFLLGPLGKEVSEHAQEVKRLGQGCPLHGGRQRDSSQDCSCARGHLNAAQANASMSGEPRGSIFGIGVDEDVALHCLATRVSVTASVPRQHFLKLSLELRVT